MKRLYVKAASLFMSVVLSGTVLSCSCSSKGDKTGDIPMVIDEAGLILSGTMPDSLPEGFSWFDFKEDTSIFEQIDGMFVNSNIRDMVYSGDRTWVFCDEYDVETYSEHLMSFDGEGQLITDTVIGDDVPANGLTEGDSLYLNAMDYETWSDILIPVDTDTGGFDVDNAIDLAHYLSPGQYINYYAVSGDKLIMLVSGSSSGYTVTVVDLVADTVTKTIELEDIMRPYGMSWLEGMDIAGDDKVVLWGSTSVNQYFGQTRYLILDLAGQQMSALDEKDYINIPLRNLSAIKGKLISVTDAGVYRIDLDAGTCELIMSFNCSNCNRYLVNNSDLLFADEDKMIFLYQTNYAGTGQLSKALCEFTRSDSYPVAGRTILTVASTGDLDYAVSEAMMRFNDESDTSFLLYDGRYKANTEMDYSNTGDADAASLRSLNSNASVSARLALDIISGAGPDILITEGANEQLSRSDYFVDLSDFVTGSGMTEDDFFMNAIDASRYNGSLYQIPVGFYVDGFLSSQENFEGRSGMTFEQYDQMVESVCGGADPVYDHQLYYSRTEVAARLFANMSELFISDGRIDVANDSFRSILDYCKDLPSGSSVTESDLNEGYEDFIGYLERLPVRMERVDSFSQFEQLYDRYPDISLCGYPSVDGRSASAGSDIAVSISAQSEDIEACKGFLGILLSQDIQHSLSRSIPINRNAARELFLEEIRSNNDWVNEGYNDGYGARLIDESFADRCIEQLSLASSSSFVDHSISLIIYEEIPAYFEGQKTFEEVAATINDRAQTVLDERQ